MESLCIRCKGKGLCGKPCKILARFSESMPRVKLQFSGSSPPEVFVGRIGYPNVFSGVLAPNEKGETDIMSAPELWVKNKLSIEQILELRGKMIYGRKQSNIKSLKNLNSAMQEIALSSKSVSAEFFLEKLPIPQVSASKVFSIMTNSAPIKKVVIEENVRVDKKVDYLTSDYDVKAADAVKELHRSGIYTSHLSKLLSAGLLGVKKNRKLVPTRWAITAVDDIISKEMLKKIKNYPEISSVLVFYSEYNGNYYNFLLLPDRFSFEVIEAEAGSVWSPNSVEFMQDYEGFFARKQYADNVTGAYYANRLGVCEYLEKIKKQASVLVLREVREEYYAPLGVGILREITRNAFSSEPERFDSIDEAFRKIQERFKLDVNLYRERSRIIQEYGKQKKLSVFKI